MTETYRTMCPMNCLPTVCGMQVEVADGQVVRVHGDPANPESRGFLCLRGRATGEIIDSPSRLLRPRVRDRRNSDSWRDVTWDQALDDIAGAIRTAGAHRTSVWCGHGVIVNMVGLAMSLRFANMLGAQLWDGSIVCWGLGGFGVWLTGVPAVNSAEDLAENAELVLLWGANLASQPTTAPRITAARKRGARVIAIDIRRTEACDHADQYMLVRPGTDAALALAMMHVIVDENLHDHEFIEHHTVGFEALSAHIAGCPPEWAEAETGVPAGDIRALAREYAASRRATILLGGSSMNKTANRWYAARAISCLPGLTGNLGRPGAGMGPRHGADAGVWYNAFGGIVPHDHKAPETVIPSEMDTILSAIESGQIEVLILPGTNMLSSYADTARLERALARVKLVVCIDLFMSDTSRAFADLVLPGTAWLEESGLKFGPSYIHLMDRVLDPPGETRPVWQMFAALAERLRLEGFFPWSSIDGLLDAILDKDQTGHAKVAELRASSPSVRIDVPSYAYATLEFPTPSGKVEFFSERAQAMGLPPLPIYEPPVHGTAYPLAFVQGRSLTQFHAFYDHGRALPSLAKADPEPVLWMSTADALSRGIGDGAMVRFYNEGGEMRARARVTERMPAGTVWMCDGWMGINRLTSSARTVPDAAVAAFPPSGSARYDAFVEVSAG
ncbi:MAG TPA: molybdopterin-dependent oxidoreductase [Candidatus Binataceae bacterium]|nr:molybdopterin-dependent oxidoreductase [Candidatus Binataceae bacterium]